MSVMAVVLLIAVLWPAAAVALALITGGAIHERDVRDRSAGPRAVVP